MRKYINKYFLLALIAGIPATAMAADGAAGGELNTVLIGLITLIIILLFAIGLLGSTLVQLGKAYRNKLREQRSSGNSSAAKTVLLLIGASLMSVYAQAQEVAEAAAPVSKSIAGMRKEEFYMLISVITLELIVLLVLMLLIKVMIAAITAKPETEAAKAAAAKIKKVSFWDRFHAAVAIEKEEDILLDHNYDGIQELDNSLPPWWKYGFYLTIFIGVIYIWYYHAGGNGPSSREEYVAEVKQGEKEVAAYLATAADNVDENSVEMLDESGIAAGKDIFIKNCVACHANDGGGNAVGPNLTDDYWLHGGSLKDVFKTIKYGWPDKGMRSWKDDFSPKQIAQLASFVKSLHGTTPAVPKDPQGELYIEAATDDAATAESGEGVTEETASTGASE
ncbi:MAG: c-type cytochrome [Chitinophagaceae bacterium]|nr:c-type cytochrome [Chitinophagaceae bacterium]